jgi:hypothetical protein
MKMSDKTETESKLSNALYALTAQWFKEAAELDNAGSNTTNRIERVVYYATADRVMSMALKVRKILRQQEEVG